MMHGLRRVLCGDSVSLLFLLLSLLPSSFLLLLQYRSEACNVRHQGGIVFNSSAQVSLDCRAQVDIRIIEQIVDGLRKAGLPGGAFPTVEG